MVLKLSKNFGKPVGKATSYYVQCSECGRVEGQFVLPLNRLTFGTGVIADRFRGRGWVYEGGWVCPTCFES